MHVSLNFKVLFSVIFVAKVQKLLYITIIFNDARHKI